MGLKRTGRINPVNRKRKAKNWERAYGSKAFVQWISRLPCWACNYAGQSPRQAAHTTTGGMGRKADAKTCIALCPACHHKQHANGWASIGMLPEDAKNAAAVTWLAWCRKSGADF